MAAAIEKREAMAILDAFFPSAEIGYFHRIDDIPSLAVVESYVR